MYQIVKRFISQKCIGYSSDFKKVHFEHVAELQDGTVKTLYSTDTRIEHDTIISGELVTERPYVAQPA